jgi:hypothetical protein
VGSTSAFHPRADDLSRKRRRILDTGSADDLEWLADVARAWAWTIAMPSLGHPFTECLEKALAYCERANELVFFETGLAPIIRHQFDLGSAPQFCAAPEFIPHDQGRELS